MSRRPPRSTRTDTRVPDPSLFRSGTVQAALLVRDGPRTDDGTGLQFTRAGGMRDELAEMKGHVLPGIRASEGLAVQVDEHGQMQLAAGPDIAQRSEEHTSELQSLMRISYAVFCFKKKQTPRH